MSWQEQLQAKMKITTGDGKVYEPLYQLSSNQGSYDFNISEFEFPEVSGTKVDRRLPKGTRYPLEFFFQGEDNIDQFKAFEASSKDRRPWELLHPVYGLKIVHPIAISFNNEGINTTKISVTVVETLLDDGPQTTLAPKENAGAVIQKAKDQNNISFTNQVTAPTVTDVTLMQSNVENLYKDSEGLIGNQIIADEYFNLYTEALSKINTAISDVSIGIATIQDFITYPSLFLQTVFNRVKVLANQAQTLTDILANLTTKNKKKIFENQKGSIVLAVVESVVTPLEGDYESAVDVFSVIESVLEIYNNYILELQTLQSLNGFDQDAYIPDYDFLFNLNYSVNYAVSNLFEIALNAQQERIIYLEEDSNVIIQAHRFYGLLPDDSTIQKFIKTNKIGMNELLQMEKGRQIKFYV